MASLLLVEDEALIRMMVADMLVEPGLTVSAEAEDVASGLSLANSADVHFAIPDLQLGTDSSGPVVLVLRRRHISFAFASGYGPTVCRNHSASALLANPFRSTSFNERSPSDEERQRGD